MTQGLATFEEEGVWETVVLLGFKVLSLQPLASAIGWVCLSTVRKAFAARMATNLANRAQSALTRLAPTGHGHTLVLNDVSSRDLKLANQLWTGGKAIDAFAPCGLWLTCMADAGDPMDFPVRTRVNGDVLQNGNTKNMIFAVSKIIAFLSRIMTLQPSDIIATGTPAGVAASHQPARFLNAVYVVEVQVAGLSTFRNSIGEPAL